MPLSDGYQTEKNLIKESEELAAAITEFFDTMGINDRRAFILFTCDLPTGLVQYISDLDRSAANKIIELWLKNSAGASNAQDSEAPQAIKEESEPNNN